VCSTITLSDKAPSALTDTGPAPTRIAIPTQPVELLRIVPSDFEITKDVAAPGGVTGGAAGAPPKKMPLTTALTPPAFVT
jgi:hypothetical protein